MPQEYDVIIIGGGPAGSTLGAILGRHTGLKVGLFEQEFFPREHIGESLISVLVPVLSYSGVLPKLLRSECYIGPKPGGIFAWDPGHEDPWCLTFNNETYEHLGIINFAVHVNRSEFDQLLLEHAREMGVEVREGVGVAGVERDGDWNLVRLEDGGNACCRILVDASGRVTSVTGVRKQFLSDYKNIAIWNHFVGGKDAGDLPGEWNIFRARETRIDGLNGKDWSPIACFACDDGWFWYIPVPKMVVGKRTRTHSVGLVTDPRILATSPEKRYTDMDVFLEKVRRVPLLCDLMADARPVSDKVLTSTNYSMISDRICDYDGRWILLGDAAFFVDPLFSTGVALAMLNAASVSFLITASLNPSLPEQFKKDLWYDYQQRLHTSALTLSICVDQWYHGIARKNPASIYWRSRRGDVPTADLRYKTFNMLGNAEVTNPAEYDYTGDRRRWIEALQSYSPGSRRDFHFMKKFWEGRARGEDGRERFNPLGGLRASDPLPDDLVLRASDGREPPLEAHVGLLGGVAVRPSLLLGHIDVRRMVPVEFWKDPLKNAALADSFPPYVECGRFYFENRPDEVEVPFLPEFEDGQQVFETLQGRGPTYGELKRLIRPGERSLVGRLHNAGMLAIG